ncbi:hypothetical protein WMW72_24120 [Paenibacillus filicis]|uniref:Uncharacterized protein n=1 Tax=Paenibacillus filicis TaxID=669464 RepID=A0ABU9DS05_9BACL
MNHELHDNNRRISVQLTVEEAMALGVGAVFHNQPQVAADARKKIRNSLEAALFHTSRPVDYELLHI